MNSWGKCVEAIGGQTDIPTIECVGPLLLRVINVLLMFSGALAVGTIILAAAMYVLAGFSGDAKAVEKAKNMITYAILGLLVILSSFAIVRFGANFLGLAPDTFFSFSFGQ